MSEERNSVIPSKRRTAGVKQDRRHMPWLDARSIREACDKFLRSRGLPTGCLASHIQHTEQHP